MHAPPPITWYRPQPVRTAVVVLIGLLITVTVPLTFPPDRGPTGFDRAVGDRVHAGLDGHPGIYHALVIPSDAYIVLPLLLIGILWCAWRRDWWAAGFLLVAPELVVAINTWALKSLWDRHLQHYLAYPSGHTVQFVAIATGSALVAATARVRIVVVAVAVVALFAVAVGMIGLGYHYPTDIVGGAALAVAAVTACWAAVASVRIRYAEHPRAAVTAGQTAGSARAVGQDQ
ncbi:phosphatase PAP2 family protein [Nocardia spumae]|uniref:phosphatase PAP2 family protein n=1 Tax=Nocardia spumae TaxID=2887190 RepID=UPI001D14EAB2|nr:phosphatase PAP2 family protein [Nocardia spumae]